MPGYYKKASALPISVIQRVILEELVQRHTSQQHHVKRAGIILLSSEGRSMTEVTEQLNVHRGTVSTWRKRWLGHQEHLALIEAEADKACLIRGDFIPSVGCAPSWHACNLHGTDGLSDCGSLV